MKKGRQADIIVQQLPLLAVLCVTFLAAGLLLTGAAPNLPSPSTQALSLGTNGVVTGPTNFFTANGLVLRTNLAPVALSGNYFDLTNAPSIGALGTLTPGAGVATAAGLPIDNSGGLISYNRALSLFPTANTNVTTLGNITNAPGGFLMVGLDGAVHASIENLTNSEANLSTNTLLAGQLAYATDSHKLHVGDGATAGGGTSLFAPVNADWNASSGPSFITNKPTLATVATSGNYNDLTNKPTIPAAQVNADWNAGSGVSQILNKPTLGSASSNSASAFDSAGAASAAQAYAVQRANHTGTQPATTLTGLAPGATNSAAYLQPANNLSDVSSPTAARTSLSAAGIDTNGNLIQAPAPEYRPLAVSIIEGGGLAASGTTTLFSTTGGPGNVESIQVALISITGAHAQTLQQGCNINFTIDGGSTVSIPFGIFFLLYGTDGDSLHSTWCTDNFAVTINDGAAYSQMGAQRRLYIPFQSSCTITLSNPTSDTTAAVFSQVQYRLGAIPSGAYGYSPLKKVIHFSYVAPQSVTQYASLTLLPTATGKGVVDSIWLYVTSANIAEPYWLEGNPTFVIDGTTVPGAGGTEDFFGLQLYGQATFSPWVTESWGMPVNRSFNSTAYATGMYRIFNKDPVTFQSSISFSWPNGQSGENSGPGTVTAGGLVIYYTTQ